MNHELIYPLVGTLIRKRRKKLRFTQEALAARLGMSRASVANIEVGRQKVLLHHLYAFAEILDLAPTDLLPPAKQLLKKDNWKTLPLPDGLKPQQREQIARLMATAKSELGLEKDAKQ